MKNLMTPWRNPGFLLAMLIAVGMAFLAIKDAQWYRDRKEAQGLQLRDITAADTFKNGVNLSHVAEALSFGVLPLAVAFLNLLASLFRRRDRVLAWLLTFPLILAGCMVVFWTVN